MTPFDLVPHFHVIFVNFAIFDFVHYDFGELDHEGVTCADGPPWMGRRLHDGKIEYVNRQSRSPLSTQKAAVANYTECWGRNICSLEACSRGEVLEPMVSPVDAPPALPLQALHLGDIWLEDVDDGCSMVQLPSTSTTTSSLPPSERGEAYTMACSAMWR